MPNLRSSIADIQTALSKPHPTIDASFEDSAYCMMMWAGGECAQKVVNHTGDGASTDNIFQVTGAVRVISITGYVTAVGDATTFSGLKLEGDDGANQDAITGTTDCSAITVGSIVSRNNKSATAIEYTKSDQVRIVDPGQNDIALTPFIMVQKNGSNTYIRASYTGDANTDVTIAWITRYNRTYVTSNIVAV